MRISDAIYELADTAAGSTVSREYGQTVKGAALALADALGSSAETADSIAEALGELDGYLPDGAKLDDKTITENGTYEASADSLAGYSSVTVAVPTPTYALTLDYDNTKGAVAITDAQETYAAGTEIELTITPGEGYAIDAIEINGSKLLDTEGVGTCFMPAAAATLSVAFKSAEA